MTTTQRPSKGDLRPDGFRFRAIRKRGGYEQWLSPQAWQRNQIARARDRARRRATDRGVPFDVTVEHLQDIFPEEFVCPVFGIKLEWGGDYHNSPSLDRIRPELGYTEGNLMWVSHYANTLKGMNSLDTLKQLVSFYEDRLKVIH